MARRLSVKKKYGARDNLLNIFWEVLSGLWIALFFVSVALATTTPDLNGDGKVDSADLTILKSQWSGSGTADLNADGTVNARDAGILFSSWGTLPSTTEWTFCANEDEFCSFSGTKEVRYGADGQYKYLILSNGTPCTNAVFGDPIVGTVKQCHFRDTSGSTPPPSTGRIQKLWLNAFHDSSQDALYAQRFDYMQFHIYGSGCPSQCPTAERIAAMKAANPNLKVLMYYLGPNGSWNWQPDWSVITTHEDWFLHGADGRRIRSQNPGHDWYVMDVNNAGWNGYYEQRVNGLLNERGFDGVFVDVPITTLKYQAEFKFDPLPTDAQKTNWHAWMVAAMRDLDAALGSKLIIANSTWWASSPQADIPETEWRDDDYLAYVDGTMNEGFAHADWQSATATLTEPWWDYQMGKYQRNLTAGKMHVGLSGEGTGADAAALKRWQDFTLATYLLMADGRNSTYAWASYPEGYFPMMSTDFGTPLGAAVKGADGVWRRDFTKANVSVNSSNTQSRGGLAPMTAQILLK